MAFNITEFVVANCAANGWALTGWWVGWIGERVYVVPLGDSDIHVSPACRCRPHAEIVNGTAMLVHDAFDGREEFERLQCA